MFTDDFYNKKLSLKLDECENKFPVEVLNIKDLTELEIIGGNFTYISEYISELINLRKLTIVTTKISEFPTEIFELPKLKYLSLKNNRIGHFNSPINSSKIETLILNKNFISNVNFLEHQFNSLSVLDLGSNLIEEIPDFFEKFIYLTRINLENNKLTKAPLILKKLPMLNHLNLDQNRFTQIELDLIEQEFFRT